MSGFIRGMLGLIAAGAIAFGLLYRPEAIRASRSDSYWLLALLVAGTALLVMFWLGRGFFISKRGLDPEERLRHNVQRVSSVILVGFLMISLQLLREQVILAEELQKPFNGVNAKGQPVTIQDPRLITQQLSNQRGRIFGADGKEVAGIAVSQYNLVKRTYAENSPVKQVLGYFSPLQFGNSGLEAAYDDYLSGKFGANPFISLQRTLLNQPTVGNDLYLTIDPRLQQVAQTALGQADGAIVLLDARSGAVLAMVGQPNFDPAQLVFDPTQDDSNWSAQIQQIQQRWNALTTNPDDPLLIRPTQGVYTPGSIFKTVTLAAMLDSGKTTPEAQWEDTGSLVVDSYRINDPNRPDATRTRWSTREGYMFSLNAVFAQMGLQLGGDGLLGYTEKFGLEKKVPFDIATNTSRATVERNYLLSRVAQAETGFGQGQLLLSPLHAALIAAAMGRGDGVLPRPYMVQQIKTREGAVIKEAKPEPWVQAVRPETARSVRDIMIASATEGYVGRNGGSLPGSGATVGGKTGTAELGKNLINGWYIAWASRGDRVYAIATVIDHKLGGGGLEDAMPRANLVLRAALANR